MYNKRTLFRFLIHFLWAGPGTINLLRCISYCSTTTVYTCFLVDASVRLVASVRLFPSFRIIHSFIHHLQQPGIHSSSSSHISYRVKNILFILPILLGVARSIDRLVGVPTSKMKQRFCLGLAVVASLAVSTNAHTIFTTLFIDDATQGEGTCVRMRLDPDQCTSPVEDVTSDDMACGVDGQKPVAFTCPASAGGKLTFQFREWANAAQPGALDLSHKGPCAIYAKQVKDMASDDAAGSGWIKLWDDGYDATTKTWCTEKLIDNKGLLSFEIPEGLPAGYWLFRPELLALHEADKGDPQFYVGCAQVFVESSNTAALNVPADRSVSIPGYVHATDPGLTFNIYTPSFPYPLPGPKVFTVPPPKNGEVDTTSLLVPNQTQGLIPANYIVKNANWIGVEVPDYKNENGCWASSENCWTQAGTCYNTAPPTGDAGCRALEKKCNAIQDLCSDGDFVGPPNKGKMLTVKEPASPASIPRPVNA
ncbi:glycosyl hydrolase family 61-domain-containing protein [Xylariaceae sp. AK1471]|nr:glycosyl hydrolase family 61-domain-containing protein [Xylariaceae sp. AK1471]